MRFVRRAPSTQFTCTRTGLVLISVAMCMTRDDRTIKHDMSRGSLSMRSTSGTIVAATIRSRDVPRLVSGRYQRHHQAQMLDLRPERVESLC